MVLLETEQLVESAGVVTRSAPLNFVNPSTEVNVGIWLLFVGATAFLGLRLWCKLDRRTGLWWDDHILVAAWVSAASPSFSTSRDQPGRYQVILTRLPPSDDTPRYQHPHKCRVRYGVCQERLGRPDAHPRLDIVLPHHHRPNLEQDGLRRDPAEDHGVVAKMGPLAYNLHPQHLHGRPALH